MTVIKTETTENEEITPNDTFNLFFNAEDLFIKQPFSTRATSYSEINLSKKHKISLPNITHIYFSRKRDKNQDVYCIKI